MKFRNFFYSILLTLFLVSQSFAFGMIGHQGWRLVANGTATAANTQLSRVANTAFVYLVSTNLSAYQTGKHYINIYNSSSGLLISGGFCSATPPAGETLSITELITNGDMELDSDWASHITPVTNARSNEQAHSGTYSRKLVTDSNYDGIKQINLTVGLGRLYKCSSWVYGDGVGNFFVSTLDDGTSVQGSDAVYPASWTNKINYFVSRNTLSTANAYFFQSPVGPSGTIYIDDVSYKQVIDPPSTGLRITSTKGGATQSWTTTGSGALNAAIIYKIYYCGD